MTNVLKTLFRSKLHLTAALLALTLVVAGGVTFGSWAVGGSGSGYSKALSSQDLTTVDATATTAASLYPGGSGSVEISIANPNPFDVTVTGIAGSGTIAADATHVTDGCTNLLNQVTFADQTDLTLSVPANSEGTEFTLTDAASMGDSANGCQGATFTIPVTLTATS